MNRTILNTLYLFLVLPKYGVRNEASYIIGTQSHGGDGGKRNVTEVPTAQRATEV